MPGLCKADQINQRCLILHLPRGSVVGCLTLLYHLATHWPEACRWVGVPLVPKAAAAVFVGTEFDSISLRGGNDGTPLRKTPWGEIAWQLGGEAALAIVAEHDQRGEAPGGEVIRRFLLKDKPSLILLDELMNHVTLIHLGGNGSKLVQEIFANASSFIKKPATLSTLVSEIGKLDWYSARKEGLGDLYEGLLEKNANEKKSGAGQYFTPRQLIDSMVTVMKPTLEDIIQDPAAGTGGFLIAANH